MTYFIGKDRPGPDGKIFTLNYDLLLYWSVLHDQYDIDWDDDFGNVVEVNSLNNDDGFRTSDDDHDAPFVVWDQFNAARKQTITFLHGGLHLYVKGAELAKLCWERSGNRPLMDQIRQALDDNRYPLFVSEGTSAYKMRRINGSAYLSRSLRSFSACCDQKKSAIFVIGHSLADNDEHILKRISKGKISKMYVSLFGDMNSDGNKAIIARADLLSSRRPAYNPLSISYIDAATLNIWG